MGKRTDPLKAPRGTDVGLVHLTLHTLAEPCTASEVHDFLERVHAQGGLEPGERRLTLHAVSTALRYLVITRSAQLVADGNLIKYKPREER